MLGNCVVFVSGLALGYWINYDKYKLARAAYQRAIRVHLRRIPSNQDVTLDDIERKKITILQHRCGVTLMREGHTDLGLSQLAMAVLAADNSTFLLRHYQQQLSPHLFRQLNARFRLLQKEFQFKRWPCHRGRRVAQTATVGTQCAHSQSRSRAQSGVLPAMSRSRCRLLGHAALSTKDSCSEGSTSFGLAVDASGTSSWRKSPTEWESISYCPEHFGDTSTQATMCTRSDADEASSLTSEAFTASSHIADSGEWPASSLCSDCFDDASTLLIKRHRRDGLVPDIAYPSSEAMDLDDWFSSSSLSGCLCEDHSLVPPRLRHYCLRLLGLRQDVSVSTQDDDVQTVNEAMRQYLVAILNTVRRTLLLYMYCSALR